MTKNNSVHEMVDVLKKLGPMTETEVFKAAFGYDRNNSNQSNKKYADMLRRGMAKGIIDRIEMKHPANRSRYLYYLKENEAGIVRHIRSSYIGA